MMMSARTSVSTRTHRATPRRAKRVVLAEDDRDMRRLLAYALRRDGYAVVEVEDGALLLEQVGTLLLESDAGDVSS
jgi:CheY-like chemotaxis protein